MPSVSSRPASAAISNNSRFIEATRQNHAVLSQAAQEDTDQEDSQLQAMVRRQQQLQNCKRNNQAQVAPLCFLIVLHRLIVCRSKSLHPFQSAVTGQVLPTRQQRHHQQLTDAGEGAGEPDGAA